MHPKSHERRTEPRPTSAWSLAVALALALGPAACASGAARGRPGSDVPPLQAFQIRTVQRQLELRGLRVEPTGVWDEPTRAATTEFQAAKGLARTGQPDYATLRELAVNPDPRFNCELYNTVDCSPTAD